MATTKARAAKRMSVRAVEDDVLATAHGLAAALHRVDAGDMRDMDRLCLPPRPDYGGAEIKRIRAATRMSQPVFARLLGVDKPDSPVVRERRGIEKVA
ncbi:MAG: hypothetical protein ACRDNS_02710 [Trebonia sp.]